MKNNAKRSNNVYKFKPCKTEVDRSTSDKKLRHLTFTSGEGFFVVFYTYTITQLFL